MIQIKSGPVIAHHKTPALAPRHFQLDESALEAMRILADSRYGDDRIVAGESAVAGLVGALGAAGNEAVRKELGLDENSRVMVFGSEGATDPELYERIVGKSADAVLEAA